MRIQPWRRELGRYWRRRRLRQRTTGYTGAHRHIPPALITVAVGVVVALVVVRVLESRLRPVLEEAARTQVINQLTAVLEQATTEELARQAAEETALMSIERDESGTITALTADTARLNLLRTQLVSSALEELEGVDVSTIQIPLGSLLDSELIWARGPSIRARALSVGTVSADFDSDFTSAGVNQTLYRIWLTISVPLTVMLPGGRVQVELDSRLCVSETVIVGSVPSTYLQMGASLP